MSKGFCVMVSSSGVITYHGRKKIKNQ